MTPCKGGFHCGLCDKKVHDLRKFSSDDLISFTTQHKEACVIVHARHETTQTHKFGLVNGTETFLLRFGFKKLAVICVAVILFCTGCARKAYGGAYSIKYPFPEKKEVTGLKKN